MTAAASAITAPTDRSMPSVPMTSAMPSATIRIGTAEKSCTRRLSRLRKFVSSAVSIATSTTIAA